MANMLISSENEIKTFLLNTQNNKFELRTIIDYSSNGSANVSSKNSASLNDQAINKN